jgi:ribosomal protein S18 acetylase RimI-like enzyme
MLQIEDRHFNIVQTILSSYPYTFYAFGSRTKTPRYLSDLDLCFFENIPGNILAHLDEDFEESDLPYKIDVVNWQRCNPTFRALIQKDLVCIQASPSLLNIEKNAFEYFAYLPKMLGFKVAHMSHATIIDCGLGSSLFNIVCETQLQQANFEKEIQQTIDMFEGQSFAWWLGPSSIPKNLGSALQKKGFLRETTEYAMLCDLKQIDQRTPTHSTCTIHCVETTQTLQDFISILEPYDQSARSFFEKIHNPINQTSQKLFVGYEKNQPVIIGTLYLGVEKDTASIFSLLTQEDKRGKGYGKTMMHHLMRYAKENGFASVSLSASSDSGFRLYEKLGFKVMGLFECYEWQ